MSPSPLSRLASLSVLAAATQDKFADLAGVRIRYIDEGKGEFIARQGAQ